MTNASLSFLPPVILAPMAGITDLPFRRIVARFGAGFFDNGKIGTYNCTPKGYGPYDSQTGYISPWSSEIIDPAAPFAYTFALVLGSIADIRAYAAQRHSAGADEPLVPAYRFTAAQTRAHCVYDGFEDPGLPVGPAGLALRAHPCGPPGAGSCPAWCWPPRRAHWWLPHSPLAPA